MASHTNAQSVRLLFFWLLIYIIFFTSMLKSLPVSIKIGLAPVWLIELADIHDKDVVITSD